MIVSDYHIKRYGWRFRVYYAVTTYWAREIMEDLASIGCHGRQLMRAKSSLLSGDLNTGITYSNLDKRESVMVISLTSSPEEFLNSWEHEKKHFARHIERAFGIDPYGEEAAYLEGTIAQKMFPVARKFLCECCKKELLCGT